MAFNTGKESSDKARIVRYTGVASCFVPAVNPDDATASKLLGYETTVTPYVSEVDVNGKKVKNVRIDFIVKVDEEKHGFAVANKLTFFLQRLPRTGSASGKTQVIDQYGRTAWATPEELKEHKIPVYASGPANISADYRPCYVGEEELTNFLINYLNIPNVQKWNNTTKKFEGLIDNPDDALARLDNIEEYFKGNFKELNTVLSYQPNNKVKLLWGVKTNDENKSFQVVYSRMTLPNRTTNYNKLAAEIQERKNAGGLQNVVYEVCDIKEYEVEATNFGNTSATPAPASDLPW